MTLRATREERRGSLLLVDDTRELRRALVEIAAHVLPPQPWGVLVEALPRTATLLEHDGGPSERQQSLIAVSRGTAALRSWAITLWLNLRDVGVSMSPLDLPGG